MDGKGLDLQGQGGVALTSPEPCLILEVSFLQPTKEDGKVFEISNYRQLHYCRSFEGHPVPPCL